MTEIYCKKTECIWCQLMANPPGVHLCTRKGEVLCLNEKGECALFVPNKEKTYITGETMITTRRCPWPCNDMYAYAGRNFCPFCGRDLR